MVRLHLLQDVADALGSYELVLNVLNAVRQISRLNTAYANLDC